MDIAYLPKLSRVISFLLVVVITNFSSDEIPIVYPKFKKNIYYIKEINVLFTFAECAHTDTTALQQLLHLLV